MGGEGSMRETANGNGCGDGWGGAISVKGEQWER